MIILGVDPGLAIVGYGVIEIIGNKIKMLEYGTIQTYPKDNTQDRLAIIYKELINIINEFKPDEVAFEKLYHEKNTKTFINVSQARGVEVLACVNASLRLYEYTPLQIKQALTGYGRATKVQMQEAVKRYLNLDGIPKPDDAADALAIAICHSFSNKFKQQFEMR